MRRTGSETGRGTTADRRDFPREFLRDVLLDLAAARVHEVERAGLPRDPALRAAEIVRRTEARARRWARIVALAGASEFGLQCDGADLTRGCADPSGVLVREASPQLQA